MTMVWSILNSHKTKLDVDIITLADDAMPKLEPDGQLIVLDTVLKIPETHRLLDTAWAAVNGSNEAGINFVLLFCTTF